MSSTSPGSQTDMRTLIVTEFITLDGVVEAPGGEPTHPHSGWSFAYGTEDSYRFKLQETLDAESLLLGRVTYEGFAAAWPGQEGAFADMMNAMPKHVATSKPEDLSWNAAALAGDVPTAVRELKDGDGGPILVAGSATLVRTLLTAGLVDELRLMLSPVLIGGGKSIWPDQRQRLDLRLAELVRFDSGATLQVYRPA